MAVGMKRRARVRGGGGISGAMWLGSVHNRGRDHAREVLTCQGYRRRRSRDYDGDSFLWYAGSNWVTWGGRCTAVRAEEGTSQDIWKNAASHWRV